MPRGGFRANAGRRKKDGSPPAPAQQHQGRPKGSPNRMGALRAERARLSGGLASEGILELGRFCKGLCAHFQPTMVDAKDKDGNTIYDETGKVKKVPVWSTEFKNTFLDLARLAIDAFGKSAPYFEQKLASVHEIRRISLERLTDAELDQLEAIVASASDEGGDTSGEVETRH